MAVHVSLTIELILMENELNLLQTDDYPNGTYLLQIQNKEK